ncbi:MAG: Gfo/Idh/MocA family oxidoreductase [Planctomycetota bacterium]|nr:Gfo/Idh/MocA family oxidoreductase [Planctomycetota bacterium]
MIKCGVIGLGRFGRLHALTLLTLENVQLTAIVARRQESVDTLLKEIPSAVGYTDLDTAIEQSGATAWIVACTTSQHVVVTRKLLEAGHHVLLEKPIADDLEDAEQLAPLVKDDSSNLMLGHILLFNSEFKVLRQEVLTRPPLTHLDAVRHRPASIVHDFAGENPLHAAMVHDLYCAQALTNAEEPHRFSCQYHLTADGQIDLANAQLIWPSGFLARFSASYMTPAGMPPRGFDRMEIFGEGWAARLAPNPRPVEFWTADQAQWPLALEIMADESGATGMMVEEQRCFLRVINGEHGVPVGARYQDGLQVQRWMNELDRIAVR